MARSPARLPKPSPGKYAGQDNGWALALIYPVVMEFDKSIVDFPSIKRFPGGASNDLQAQSSAPGQSGAVAGYEESATVKGGGG